MPTRPVAPAKKSTRTEWGPEQKHIAQADEITRILAYTCDLLDFLLVDRGVLEKATPLIERMRAFLDRRGTTAEDPTWVAKMKRTVAAYARRARDQSEDPFSID